MARVEELGLDDLRDGVLWSKTERSPGSHDVSGGASQIGALVGTGRVGSLTVFPQNPFYEAGQTVVSDAGIAAFAAHTAALALAFPDLPAIEVANEFNSTSFVSGPAKNATPGERARLHARHLAAIAARPELANRRILGGAAHSVAAGFIWHVLDAGGAAHMDAVVVHPYTSPPERFADEVSVLRRHPAMAGLEVEVTEFGSRAIGQAADFFWRNYCAFAEAGVSRAAWYPLAPRGDGYAPLVAADLSLTPVGRAFLFAQSRASGTPAVVFRADPFTYGCVFGDHTAVIWGEPRDIEVLRPDLEVRTADLAPMKPPFSLAPERVILLTTDGAPLRLSADLRLGASSLAVDSFHQFGLPPSQAVVGPTGLNFERFLRLKDGDTALITCPGQDVPGRPWHPYLCSDTVQRFWLHARGFALGGSVEAPVALVHRLTTGSADPLDLQVSVDLNESTTDGVVVSVLLDGEMLDRRAVAQADVLDFKVVPLRPGQKIDIVLDPAAQPRGDSGRLRISARHAEEPAE
ncbi:MAG: hypothetical protein AAF667_02070 [Pseudomonadota bacterium]